jgi:tripartite-type tricarboxylate transporter receptor subunit TctC
MSKSPWRIVLASVFLSVAAVVAGTSAGIETALPAPWPDRPVRVLVTFPAGSANDAAARVLGDALGRRWGKPVVVENRPGGDGLVAINAFTSANDDHTLLFVPTSAFTAHPYTHDKLPYDSERDLVPIVSVTTIVVAFAVPGDSEVKSLAEFVALARAKPDTLNVAAAAGNSELIMSSFIKTQNLPVAKVPYRDIIQAPNDLAQGRIQALLTSYAAMLGLIQSGKIKILAITSSKRVAIAPDVPTVTEAGFPFLGMDSLIGIYGPRGMPDALRDKIAADVRAVIDADATIAQRLAATAQIVDVRGPAEFATGIKEMREQLADIAKVLGIKAAQQAQ